MKFPMFSRAALSRDVRKKGLYGLRVFAKGTAGSIIEYFPGVPGREPAYILEIVDENGDGDVFTVTESALGPEPEAPPKQRSPRPAGRRAR